MDPATAHVGDVITVQRSKKVYGAGRDKLVYSYVEATQLPRRGVIEGIFPRFALVRMFANLLDAKENGEPLYYECFYWPEITGTKE